MAIQPLREHPLLKGKKLIGRGMFSAVFETGPDTVLKLTVDSVNYALLVGPARMIGAHFPHVLEDQGEVGKVKVGNNRVPVFLYEMERLQKLSVSSLAKRTATLLSKGFRRFIVSSHSGPLDFDRFDALTCSSALAPELRTAFAAIRRFIIRQDHSRLDISMANLMQRSDGELILADPVCDDYLLSQTCYYY